ncbi:HEAT repeat domain-containing protein [bacterium]|nr:HEAT repeat domain-containing protein [bacterium]
MKHLSKQLLLALSMAIFAGLLNTCSSSGEVTSDMVDESYQDYRDGKKKALNNLISYYRNPALPMEIRKASLLKVIESNDPVGLQAIRNSLQEGNDLDYTLFKTGVQALSKTKDKENTKTILKAMQSSRAGYVSVRDEMFAIIEDQVDARSVGLILKLYADAEEDYSSFLQNLTLTLGKMDDARVVPILMSIAANKKINIGIRNLAVEILATKNDPAIARLLAEMLDNPATQDQVKTFAISIMDEMKDERLLSSLIDALHNEQATYYSMLDAITRALGNFDDPELKLAMIKVARDDQMPSRFRKRAINSLSVYKDPKIVDELVEILNNPDNFIYYNDIRDLVAAVDSPELQQKLQHVARSTQASWEKE